MVYKHTDSIVGVDIHPLKIFEDARGAVMHMLRKDHPSFTQFGEIYFSKVNAGFVKGWKRHKQMTQNFAVPFGQLKLIILDLRQGSKTENCYAELLVGMPNDYNLVTIPPNLWYAFYSATDDGVILANCSDLAHNPSESEQQSLDAFDVDVLPNMVQG